MPPDLAQSFLFVPADEAKRVEKAARAGADAVILDLEDAVVPARKPDARSAAAEFLRARRGASSWLLRLNGAGTPYFADDLEVARAAKPDAVVLPKADPGGLERLPDDVPPVVALIETAAGLAAAAEVAAHPTVVRLQLGAVDLALELGLRPGPDGLELLHPRATLVLASALAGLPGPIDSVFLDLRDLAGLERDARQGRALGCTGKACIHPSHLAVLHDVFRPTPDEVEQARSLLATWESADGAGAIQHEGRMVDRPVVDQARRLVETAARLG